MVDVKSWQCKVSQNLEKVIVGKSEVLRWVIACLVCHGHLLLEDVPGVSKTALAKTVAATIGCSFHRVQCTPDLLPSDITGVTVYDQREGEFVFRPGPVFAQVLLVDEINRATPRTQAALLEAMEERQVTIDGTSYPLPEPFFVIATQNPVEFAGTFPLPEAQLDRFFARLSLGYPDPKDEVEIFRRQKRGNPINQLPAVTSAAEVLAVQEKTKTVHVSEEVADYAVALVGATRQHSDVTLGSSPRGSISLLRAAQALAAMSGRNFTIPDDVKLAAPHILAHRLMLSPESVVQGRTGNELIAELLQVVDPPVDVIERS